MPNAFPQRHEVERGHVHGRPVHIEMRYPLPAFTDGFVNAVKKGAPTQMPKKEWLTEGEWRRAYGGASDTGVKRHLQDLMDYYHSDVKRVTSMLDNLAKGLHDLDGEGHEHHDHDQPEHDEEVADGYEGEGDHDDGLDGDEQEAVAGLNQSVSLGMAFQGLQQNCKQIQTIAMKVDPDHAKAGALNCYLDFNEKQAMKRMWQEISELTEALKESSVPTELALSVPGPSLRWTPRSRHAVHRYGFRSDRTSRSREASEFLVL